MTQETTLLEELFRRVDELARPVLFEKVPLPEAPTEAEPPPGGRLWQSPYALLMVYPVDLHDIESSYRKASYWLDDLLCKHEDEGRPMDGYLLLALESAPSPDERGPVRAIEQDPSFCRKHVLWPVDGSWENRLERVTVLTLAETPSPAEPAMIPELPAKAEDAWERFQAEDKVTTIVKSILSEIGSGDASVTGE